MGAGAGEPGVIVMVCFEILGHGSVGSDLQSMRVSLSRGAIE